MNFQLLFSIISSFFVLSALGQDVNGIWRGELTQDSGGCYSRYFIELQLQHNGDQIEGVSYDYYDTSKFVKLNFNGRINTTTKRIVLIENHVIEYKIPNNCIPCIKTYDLTWSKKNNEEQLSGTWKGLQMGSTSGCPPGTIYLKKVASSTFKTEELIQDPLLADIQKNLAPISRKIDLIQTIPIESPTIKVEFYDNGQIDGDTISVFLNDLLILYKKGLSEKPITLTVPVHPSRDYKMVMFAENLGSIPPNTALMVVTSGKKKYEVFLSSSIQQSAAVKFRYEK